MSGLVARARASTRKVFWSSWSDVYLQTCLPVNRSFLCLYSASANQTCGSWWRTSWLLLEIYLKLLRVLV